MGSNKAVRNVMPTRPYNKKPPYEIIIPAAGMGSRMKYHGPKPLIKLNDSLTLLQHQLNMIRQLSNNPPIILISGFKSEKIMNLYPSLLHIENERYEETNVVRSIGMGLRATSTDHVIIIYGDLVFNEYALAFPLNESLMVIDSNEEMSSKEVGCVVQDGHIEYLAYGLPKKWAQIILLTGHELQLAKKLCWDKNNVKCYGFEIINRIIDKKGKFKAYQPHKLKVTDVDCLPDIIKAKSIV